MIRFRLLILLLLSSPVFASKEYKNIAAYHKDFPLGNHDGTDGNWLTSDRKHRNQVWSNANETNLHQSIGYQAYQSIQERADFYNWYHHKIKGLGFETKWSKLAATTTRRMCLLLGAIPCIAGYSNPEIKAFIKEGNELIFNDSWIELNQQLSGKVLKGNDAKNWDGNVLLREQKLVHPIYLKLSVKSLNKLEKLLRKENFATKFFPGFEFKGSLLSIDDVYSYGMRMMGYKVAP